MRRDLSLSFLLPWLFVLGLLAGAELGAQGSLGVVGASEGPNVVNPRSNRIYVVNSGGGSLIAVDGYTHAVTNLPLPAGTFPQGLAVNPVSNRIYVNSGGNQVQVLDGNSHAIVNTLSGAGPVAFNLHTGRIYLLTGSALRVLDASETEIANLATVSGRVIAVDPLHNQIFVADTDASQLRVIDGVTHAVQTLTLSGGSPVTVAVNPQTRKVYVAQYSDQVTEVDAQTLVMTPITVAENPTDLVIDPLLNKIYVAHNPSVFTPAAVTVIDGATRATTSIPAGIRPAALAFDVGTRRIFVSNFLSGSVTVIDADTQTAVASVGWGSGVQAGAISLNPVTHRVYVQSPLSAGMAVIDGSTLTLATHVAGLTAYELAYDTVQGRLIAADYTAALKFIHPQTGVVTPFTPVPGAAIQRALFDAGANRIYAHHSDGRFSLIDGATLSVRTTSVISTGVYSAMLDPARDRAFLVDNVAGSVHVLSGADLSVTPVAVGNLPYAGTLDPVSGAFYVLNQGTSNSVTRIDGATLATVTVAPSARPTAMVLDAASNRLIIALQNVPRVAVMNATTLALSADINLVSNPQSIAFNPRRNLVYIGHGGSVETRMSLLNSATLAAPTTLTLGGNSTRTVVDAANDRVFAFYYDSTVTYKLAILRGPGNSMITRTLPGAVYAAVTDPLSGRFYFVGTDVMRVDPDPATASTLSTVVSASGGNATPAATATLNFIVTSGATPTPTTPVAVFYRRGYDAWSAAAASGGGNFNGSVSLGLGAHYVQAFAIDGFGGTTQSVSGLSLPANAVHNNDSGRPAGYAITRILQTTVTTTTTIGAIVPEPSLVGQSYSVPVVVSGSATPTGTVQVSDGAGHNCAITLAAGTGSCTLAGASTGAYTITANYAAQGNFLASQDTESHQVDPAATTTAIVSDLPDPSLPGQPVTVQMTIVVQSPGAGVPTGDLIALATPGGVQCSGNISGGAASCQLALSALGSSTITASYAGNASYAASQSAGSAHLVEAGADLSISVDNGQAQSTAGTPVSYTIVIGNAGPQAAPGARAQDSFESALTPGAWTCAASGGASCVAGQPAGTPASGSGALDQLVDIPVGGALNLVQQAQLSPAHIGTVTASASIVGTGLDGQPANNNAADTDQVERVASIGIVKSNNCTYVPAGDVATYQITVSNLGPSNAPGTHVTDPIPTGFGSFQWNCLTSGGASCAASGSGAIDEFVSLPVGSQVQFVLLAFVPEGGPPTVTNTATATVAAGVSDPTPTNNQSSDTDLVALFLSGFEFSCQ